MPLRGQDQVVVDRDPHRPGGGQDLPGQGLVPLGRFQAPGRVVMGQDEPGRVQIKRPSQDLPWINRRMVHGAFLHILKSQKMVAVVEKKGGEDLSGTVPDLLFKERNNILRTGNGPSPPEILLMRQAEQVPQGLEMKRALGREPPQLLEGGKIGPQDPPDIGKDGNQFLGVRLGIPVRDRKRKKQFQELVIPKGSASLGRVFLPQALAVAQVIRPALFPGLKLKIPWKVDFHHKVPFFRLTGIHSYTSIQAYSISTKKFVPR